MELKLKNMAEEIAEIQNYIFLNSIIPLKTIVLGKKLHAVLRLLIARYCFIKLHYGKYYMYECCTDVFSQYTVPWKKTEVRVIIVQREQAKEIIIFGSELSKRWPEKQIFLGKLCIVSTIFLCSLCLPA